MRQLSTLLLSLLLCATCLAQPDSRPGPYQATLAKINALLVGGAATVKEIEFTVDGSALASSSKTQVYSDGNAGNVTANVPDGKAIKLAVAGTQVAQIDSTGLTLVKNLYYNGAGSASSTLTTMWADAANGNKFANVPTGKYEQHRVGGYGALSLGRVGVTTGDSYWALGLYNANGVAESSVYGGISNELTTMILNVPTGNTIKFKYNAVEKYRFAAALAEFDRLSLGGTIGSSVDPGAGALALTNRIQFAGAGTADSTKSLIYASAADGPISISVPSAQWMRGLVGDAPKWYADSTGFGVSGNSITITTSQSPASNGTGTAGQIAWDANYIYVCTATNTWKRAALTGGY